MKKSGMNKLIELLNIYRKEKYPKSKLMYYKYDSLNHEFLSNCIPNDSEEKILGRRFGFIKRLVENDKIDYNKDKYGMIFYENGNQKFLSSEDEVIMELSIQDSPIEFLISILKIS